MEAEEPTVRVGAIPSEQLRNAHNKKLLLTYYLNISVQAATLSDCRIESNRIESKLFCPTWSALQRSPSDSDVLRISASNVAQFS